MGPTCEVRLGSVPSGKDFDRIDAALAREANEVVRTRKGRTWDVWVRTRPVQVTVDSETCTICLSAGCNSAEDYDVLRGLAGVLAETLGGTASNPVK